MSFFRIISPLKSQLRWLLTFHWQPMTHTGKPPTNPLRKAIEIEKRFLGWLRRHWKLTLILVLVVPFTMGMMMRLTGMTFSIYEDYGVDVVGSAKVGPIWDMIWEFRGQPPGYEDTVDGFLGIGKATGSEGLNGPLNIFFLPFEFILVDMMLYFPAFFDPSPDGINILENFDMFVGLITIKMGADGIIAAVAWSILSIPIAVFIFLFIFFGGFYAMPITNWVLKNTLNFIKLLILLVLVVAPIILFFAFMNQDVLKETFSAILTAKTW